MFKSDASSTTASSQIGTPAQRRRNISKDRRDSVAKARDVEKSMLNNEYLKILKDPKFADMTVNFLE